MKIAHFSVTQTVTVNLIAIIILLSGGYAYLHMTQEVFPQFPLKIITITTIYPRVAPEEIEKVLTVPIEEELADIEDVNRTYSISVEGRSQIVLELNGEIDDVQEVLDQVRQQVEFARADLPEDAEDPIIQEMKFVIPAVTYALSGPVSKTTLKQWTDALEDQIREVAGVASVVKAGVQKREVQVRADPLRLEAYGISLQEVLQALARFNVNMPAGTMDATTGEIFVRTVGEVEGAGELEKVVLRQGPPEAAGAAVQLRDVARVLDTFEKPKLLSRVNGSPAAVLIVSKGEDTDAILLKDRLDEQMEAFRKRLPPELTLTEYNDTSKYIRRRIQTMHTSFLLGLCMVVFTLYIFLDARMALMTAMGIPVALAFAMLAWSWIGGTANLLSLFSMILVLGMIVDDGIIICENIYRHIERGLSPVRAAIVGTKEVFWAVLLAVSTTIAAFMPLLLIEGRMGGFLAVIPKVACLALLGSLIEAFVILPSHIAEWGKRPRKDRTTSRAMRRVLWVYGYILKIFLRRRYVLVPGAILISVGAVIFAFQYMDIVFVHTDYLDFYNVKIETGPRNSVEATARILDEAERRLSRATEGSLDSVVAVAGRMETEVEGFFRIRSNVGQVTVDVNEDYALRTHRDDILAEARGLLSDLPGATSIRIDTRHGGPPSRKDVEVTVTAADHATALTLANDIEAYLGTVTGVTDVGSDFEAGKTEARVRLDTDRAAMLGFDTATVAGLVGAAYGGTKASTVRWGRDEVEITVQLEDDPDFRPGQMADLILVGPRGNSAPLDYLAQVETRRGPDSYQRRDRRPAVTVTANLIPGAAGVIEVTRDIQERYAELPPEFAGCRLIYEGGNEDLQLMIRSIQKAGLLALLLIYMILGTLFRSFVQPFIVMCTVPFSLIGIVFGLLLANEPLSFMALLGSVALAGIVVNDSLVLVDFINQDLRTGRGLLRCILRAAHIRFRPILLTSITTVVGLLPLAVGVSGQEQFLSPMALVIIWGLAFSTLLTLLAIPAVFLIMEDLRRFFLGPDPDRHARDVAEIVAEYE